MSTINNIILIGYRATGKTTVAQTLAPKLNMTWVDLDQVITEQEELEVSQIVAKNGWDYFRGLEKKLLAKYSQKPGTILATGGGAILHQDIWPSVHQGNLIIWLKASTEVICQRLKQDEVSNSQRPSLTGQDICQEVNEVLAIRTPLYQEGSDLQIDSNQPLAIICQEIIDHIKSGS